MNVFHLTERNDNFLLCMTITSSKPSCHECFPSKSNCIKLWLSFVYDHDFIWTQLSWMFFIQRQAMTLNFLSCLVNLKIIWLTSGCVSNSAVSVISVSGGRCKTLMKDFDEPDPSGNNTRPKSSTQLLSSYSAFDPCWENVHLNTQFFVCCMYFLLLVQWNPLFKTPLFNLRLCFLRRCILRLSVLDLCQFSPPF